MFRLPSAIIFGLMLAAACSVGPIAAQTKRNDADAPAVQQPDRSKRIDELIRQLVDKKREARQRAEEELTEMGNDAIEPLRAASDAKDEALAARAKYVLRLIHIEWMAEGDPQEVKECLSNYETLSQESRMDAMRRLAGLPNAQGAGALCRLVRYESSVLSKRAALALWFDGTAMHAPNRKTAEVMRGELRNCKRPAAAWIETWLRLAEKPGTAAADWAKLIEDEMQLSGKNPDETSADVVAALIFFQATWLKQLDKTEERNAPIRRLAELDYSTSGANAEFGEEMGRSFFPNSPNTLMRVVIWLTEQKAWETIDALSRRLPDRFAADRALLYLQALAYEEQGKREAAEKTALQAFRGQDGGEENPDVKMYRRFSTAILLRARGQNAWARRELESLVESAPLTGLVRPYLADMLHEQGENLEAAAVLEKIAKAVEAGKMPGDMQFGNPKEICAKRQYYLACHWKTQNNPAKERECLEKALKDSPDDIDVLIACYQSKGQPPEFHKRIVEQVRAVAAGLLAATHMPDVSATDYNNYAWLIANTEGDLDEALRFSRKSLEADPNVAGYLDTLAHVYAAKGDLREAVKIQTRAMALEPRSPSLKRHLEAFRKKLEGKNAGKSGSP